MKKALLCCASALCALGSVPAFAQTAPAAAPAGPVGEGDIVVTARRVAENLQDVPLAVSAVSGATLQRQAVKELRDLTSTVPNLSIYRGNGGGSQIVVSIRGQIQSNNGLLYVDPAVGVYVDGFNVPRNSGLRVGLVDISRVEVLRGPQGTLYGRNTTGGAVSIVTNDPVFNKVGASVSASYGNYNAYNVLGTLNLPITDNLAWRFVFQRGEHGAYGHQVSTGVGLGDEHSTYLRSKVKWESGNFKATLYGDYFKYRSNGITPKLVGLTAASTDPRFSGGVANVPGAVAATAANPTGLGFYPVAGGASAAYVQRTLGLPLTPAGLDQASAILASYVANNNINFYDTYGNSGASYGFPLDKNRSNSRGGSASLDLSYTLNDIMSLRSISGYRGNNRADAYDLDSTPFNISQPDNTVLYDDFYSEEFQFLGNTDKLKWVLGGFYSYEDGIDFTPSIALQAAGANNYSLADGKSRQSSKALFGQASYNITDKLTLTLGARYTWDVKKLRNRNRNIGQTAANGTRTETCALPPSLLTPNAGCQADFSNSFHKPSWLASLDYKLTRDVLAYAKFSYGYRAGGQQGRANVQQLLAYTPFAPETLSEYEGGIKSELFDRRLRLNLAAYYDTYKNVQRGVTLLAPTGGNYTLITNAATARLYGFEGESSLAVVDHFRVNGTFGYLNAKYKHFVDAALGDRTAEPWPAPKWTYSIGGTYDTPTKFGSFIAGLSWDGRSSQNLQPQGLMRSENVQKAYGLLNGNLTLHFDDYGLDVSAYGRNILGKHYYTAGTSLESLGLNVLLPGDPRTYGITITKKFGDL